jgi:uncharacterized protein
VAGQTRIPIVDADGHVIEPFDLWDRYMDVAFRGMAPLCDRHRHTITVAGRTMSRFSAQASGYGELLTLDERARFAAQSARGYDAGSQLETMDAEGIQAMVLYPTRGLYLTAVDGLDPRLGSEMCRAYGRWLRDFCDHDPARLLGVGLVCLHDPATALEDARYAVESLGFRAIMLRPNPINGRRIDDLAFDPMYAYLADAGAVVTSHEGTGTYLEQLGNSRFDAHSTQHLLNHPFEQMAAVVSFVLGGVLQRHPGLRVAFLESGGGWVPYWLFRMDEHFEWLKTSEDLPLEGLPSEYFKRQCWVQVEGGEPGIGTIVETVGPDRILWASDYPHADGTFPGMAADALARSDISEEVRRAWLRQNALEFYGLVDRVPVEA